MRVPIPRSLVVWFVSALVLLPPTLIGVVVHDEGLIATGAMMIRHGRHPYIDFLSFYGPAQYYLLAGLFSVAGEDLFVLRLLHTCWMAGLIVGVWAVARRLAGDSTVAPLVAAATALAIALYAKHNAGYPAIPATAWLLAAGCVLWTWTPAVTTRPLLVASLFIGVAGLFRWDFGIVGVLALTASVGLSLWVHRAALRDAIGRVAACVAPAVILCAAVYVPMIARAGPRRWYDEVVAYALFEFPRQRGIEFIRPAYWEGSRALEHGELLGAIDAATRLAYVTVPPLVALAVFALIVRWATVWRTAHLQTELTLVIYQSVLSCLLLQQMRVRPHVWQGFPAVIAAIPVAVYVWRIAQARTRALRLTSSVLVTTGVIVALAAAVPQLLNVFRGDLVSLDHERARFIRVEPRLAHYGPLVRYLRTTTSPRDAMYSGARDHSRMFVCDSLLYFLVNRLPADPWMELEPGIANTPTGQRTLVHVLERERMPVIVLFDFLSDESNLSAKSNGVTALDDFIDAHYAPQASFGPYAVWRRVGGTHSDE